MVNISSNGLPVTTKTKAIVAAISSFMMFLAAALGDDIFEWGEVGEGLALLFGVIATTGGVFQVRNKIKGTDDGSRIPV